MVCRELYIRLWCTEQNRTICIIMDDFGDVRGFALCLSWGAAWSICVLSVHRWDLDIKADGPRNYTLSLKDTDEYATFALYHFSVWCLCRNLLNANTKGVLSRMRDSRMLKKKMFLSPVPLFHGENSVRIALPHPSLPVQILWLFLIIFSAVLKFCRSQFSL